MGYVWRKPRFLNSLQSFANGCSYSAAKPCIVGNDTMRSSPPQDEQMIYHSHWWNGCGQAFSTCLPNTCRVFSMVSAKMSTCKPVAGWNCLSLWYFENWRIKCHSTFWTGDFLDLERSGFQPVPLVDLLFGQQFVDDHIECQWMQKYIYLVYKFTSSKSIFWKSFRLVNIHTCMHPYFHTTMLPCHHATYVRTYIHTYMHTYIHT